MIRCASFSSIIRLELKLYSRGEVGLVGLNLGF